MLPDLTPSLLQPLGHELQVLPSMEASKPASAADHKIYAKHVPMQHCSGELGLTGTGLSCWVGASTMSFTLLTPKSLSMLLTDEYSLQSSGSPSALFASTVSRPFSCNKACIISACRSTEEMK